MRLNGVFTDEKNSDMQIGHVSVSVSQLIVLSPGLLRYQTSSLVSVKLTTVPRPNFQRKSILPTYCIECGDFNLLVGQIKD